MQHNSAVISPSASARVGATVVMGPTAPDRPIVPRAVATFLGAWFALACGFALLGPLRGEPRLTPVVIWGVVLAVFASFRRSPALRGWLNTVPLGPLILFHVVRLGYGLGFLALASEGRLAPAFASVAGWGDLLAGGLAPVAAFVASRSGASGRRLVLGWNVLALADILLVFVIAQRLLFGGQVAGLLVLTGFPFSLLPPLVVPLVLLTHAVVFWRLLFVTRSAQP